MKEVGDEGPSFQAHGRKSLPKRVKNREGLDRIARKAKLAFPPPCGYAEAVFLMLPKGGME